MLLRQRPTNLIGFSVPLCLEYHSGTPVISTVKVEFEQLIWFPKLRMWSSFLASEGAQGLP
jgi:hypothetical protein